MQRCGLTSFCAPPTVWRMLIQSDLTALRNPPRVVVGAGENRSTPGHRAGAEGWGVTIRDGFGQTETTVQIANTPGQTYGRVSMGRPVPGYRGSADRPASGEHADEGEIACTSNPRPLGLMVATTVTPT